MMNFEFDTRFKHSFSMLIAGASGSGKTYFTKDMFNRVDQTLESIVWFYEEWQPLYESLSEVTFVKGMPSTLDEYLQIPGAKMMVFDDMMSKCAESDLICQTFTRKRHHQNLSVVFIVQNLFCQGKVMRNIHLNTEYFVLFRNPRDKSQFGHFARQLETLKSKQLIENYMTAISKPYDHFLVDLKPHTPDQLRYRSNSLQDIQYVYTLN